MLLNKIPAHRSRLAGHEVEDVIQYRVSPYYGVEQWLVKWAPDGWRSTWEDGDTLLDLAVESARRRGARPSQLEEEWLMQRAAEVKARDA